jgi:hypothetical protein
VIRSFLFKVILITKNSQRGRIAVSSSAGFSLRHKSHAARAPILGYARELVLTRPCPCLWRAILVQQRARVYPQNSMGTKLLMSVLALLSAADSGAALICAASCMSSPPVAGALVHHHETGSQPNATHASQYTHHHGAPCAECPPRDRNGNSLNQSSDCNSLSEIHALKEGSFSVDAPRAADGLASGSDGQQSFLLRDFPTTRSFGPTLLPLRI